MSTDGALWARRLRWRLLGAWRWPLFAVLTIADGLIAHALPPSGARTDLVPALVFSSFANLFLIGVVAPWLARRIVERQGAHPAAPSFPPADHTELLTDRIAAIALVLATLGVVAAGLGNHKVVVADTDRLGRGGDAARAYVLAHAPAQIRERVDAMNSHALQEDGFFRMCVPYVDARKQYCMYVDAARKPPTVRRDPDTRPNQVLFPQPSGGF